MIGDSDRVKLEEREDMVVVKLTRDILDDAEDMRDAVRCALERGRPRIIFDISRSRYISARVLGVIAECINEARRAHGEVKVLCPDNRLRQLLETMGFCHAVEIVLSSSDALDGYSDGILTPEKIMLWKESEVYASA